MCVSPVQVPVGTKCWCRMIRRHYWTRCDGRRQRAIERRGDSTWWKSVSHTSCSCWAFRAGKIRFLRDSIFLQCGRLVPFCMSITVYWIGRYCRNSMVMAAYCDAIWRRNLFFVNICYLVPPLLVSTKVCTVLRLIVIIINIVIIIVII